MTITRRHFLTSAGALALAGCSRGPDAFDDASGTTVPAGVTTTTTTTEEARVASRRLVVVQLSGGNDALDTVVPVIDGRYHDARPALALGEADVVPLTDGLGLHTALEPLAGLWEIDRLAVVAGVGFADNSRSHFQALDRWWRAGDGSTGWLGRWLDVVFGAEADPLTAVAIGPGSPALQARVAPSTVIGGQGRLELLPPPGIDEATWRSLWARTGGDDGAAGAVSAAGAALDVLGPLLDSERGSLGSSLATAADVLVASPATRIVVVGAGGFDTHSAQAATHELLLGDLAAGLVGFFESVDEAGLGDDVLVVTTSEFGRRIAENGSGGTDHGLAGVQFLAGSGVRTSTVVGDLDLAGAVDGDLPVVVDTRSLYAEALEWIGGPVDDVLGPVDPLGIV